MHTITEIESAIQRLPATQVAELAAWLEQLCAQRARQTPVEAWLARARGAAQSGVTTTEVMTLTRGEQ